jgi:hypothetical protein
MAIGGDHGMDAGTDLSIMIVVGVFMGEFHFGTAGYLVIGEKIIETTFGEVIHGTIIIYIIVTFKETGESGMIPTIGIDQNIENLHIAMMEECTLVILIKDVEKVTLARGLRVLDRVRLPKVVLQLGKERLEQVGTVPQVPESIAQVKPLKVNILERQKGKRNEVSFPKS